MFQKFFLNNAQKEHNSLTNELIIFHEKLLTVIDR